MNRVNESWDALLVVMRGGQSPLAKHPEPVASSRTVAPSEAAARAKQNSELLQEIFRVVFDRDPQDRAQFGTLLDTLNQGASLEGIYNGLTHSSEYRKLEVSNPGARPDALSFFASEVAHTEALVRTPTEFAQSAAQPLAVPVQPDGSDEPGTSEVDYASAATPKPSASAEQASAASADPRVVDSLERKYMSQFADSSIFTLKRVLGEEILRLVDEKSRDPKALQAWYGNWVVRMCATGVDFGVPLRNKADAEFHARWAATADLDRLKWEVLNRIHRILNIKNAPKSAMPSAVAPPGAGGGA